MTLEQLFKKRRNQYLKALTKYAKIIVNDHFILLFFILSGAGGFAYSEYLNTVTPGMIEPRLLVGFLYFILTATSSVRLLLEPADQIFLLPKEQGYRKIFKQSVVQSFLTSLVSLAMLAVITFPIFVTTLGVEIIDMGFVFVTLVSLKSWSLIQHIQPFFELDEDKQQTQGWLLHVLRGIALISLLFINIRITSVVVGILSLLFIYQFTTQTMTNHVPFKWDKMIETEDKRMQRLYRFLSMFVNVPNIQTDIKRLVWLDKALTWLSYKQPNAAYFYVLRLVARNTEYSLLIIRAILVGAVLLMVTKSMVISTLLIILFLYIIGFQLLPLVPEMERVAQFQMYPIMPEVKSKAVFQLVFQILFIANVFLALASVVSLGWGSFGILLIGLLFAYIFSFVYAPRRLRSKK